MAKEPKGAVLTLRISEQEQENLRRAAEERGQTVSEYVRTVVRTGHTATADVTVVHSGEQNFSSTASSSQRTGQNLQVHGGSWIVTAPGQHITGDTMTVVMQAPQTP